MKTTLIALLLLPLLSYGQVSRKDKKNIESYANTVCECISNLMDSLHPKTIEVVLLMGEKGQEEAMVDIQKMTLEMNEEELQEFLVSFETMGSDAFTEKIDNCEKSGVLSSELKEEIDNENSAGNSYFMELLETEEGCNVMNALYVIGKAVEE